MSRIALLAALAAASLAQAAPVKNDYRIDGADPRRLAGLVK